MFHCPISGWFPPRILSASDQIKYIISSAEIIKCIVKSTQQERILTDFWISYRSIFFHKCRYKISNSLPDFVYKIFCIRIIRSNNDTIWIDQIDNIGNSISQHPGYFMYCPCGQCIPFQYASNTSRYVLFSFKIVSGNSNNLSFTYRAALSEPAQYSKVPLFPLAWL